MAAKGVDFFEPLKPALPAVLHTMALPFVSVKAAQEQASRGAPVSWLTVDADKAAGRLVERPTREAIPVNAQEQLIVELYSK